MERRSGAFGGMTLRAKAGFLPLAALVVVAMGCGSDSDPRVDTATVIEVDAGRTAPPARSDEAPRREAVEPPPAEGPLIAPTPAEGTPGENPQGEHLSEEGSGERPVFTRPDSLRGIYLNAWSAGSARRLEALIELARRTEINAFVIDIKDATGFVSHPSALPGVRDVGATGELRIRDLPGLLRRLEAEGIYPIARIVIVKDPLLAAARPELAVQDTAGGVWVDSKGIVWLNLYDERVWRYHTALAIEVARMGFPEIQWDYVRFPDAPASDLGRAHFPGDSIGPRTEAVRAFLTHAREELRRTGLDLRSTADVFGVTTSFERDVGIGQLWERFIDRVDAALPMVYPSHYWEGSFGYGVPNHHPYEIVRRAVTDAIRRTEAVDSGGAVIPWLQDFTLGAPRYGAPEVRAQIQATYDAGAKGWILWNPGSRYTEEALRPAEGFEEEPEVRIGTRVVPVGERFEALELIADSIADARADSGGGAAVADSARGGVR